MRRDWAFLLFFGMLTACTDQGPEIEPARLIPGSSVDGISCGMSWEAAVGLLGEGYRYWTPDGSPAAYGFVYITGPHAGLTFYVVSWGGGFASPLGPIFAIEAIEPYQGRTKEGIGMESTSGEVRQAFGSPAASTESAGMPLSDQYWFAGMSLTFHYYHNKVWKVSIK